MAGKQRRSDKFLDKFSGGRPSFGVKRTPPSSNREHRPDGDLMEALKKSSPQDTAQHCASSLPMEPLWGPTVSPAHKQSGDVEAPAIDRDKDVNGHNIQGGVIQGGITPAPPDRRPRTCSTVTIKEPSPQESFSFSSQPPDEPLLAEAAEPEEFKPQGSPKTAALLVALLSVAMGAAAVVQERLGSGVEANSAKQEGAPPISGVNTLWVIISTALVMIMTPAVALYYGGMVSEDQVLNRMVRTFVNLGLVGFQWIWIGYTLSFAPSNPHALDLVGDFSFVALSGVGTSPAGSLAEGYGIPHLVFVMFHLMYASITTTILSGSVANLMSFHAFCPFILAWTTLVYDPICHAVWGGGLLSWHLDFAGGLVIHVSSGVSAAAAATYLYRLSHNVEATLDKPTATGTRVSVRMFKQDSSDREDREEKMYVETSDVAADLLEQDLKKKTRRASVKMRRPSTQLYLGLVGKLGSSGGGGQGGGSEGGGDPHSLRTFPSISGEGGAGGQSATAAGSKRTSERSSEFLNEDESPSAKELVSYLFEPGYTKDHEMVWDRALGDSTIAHNRAFVVLGAVLLWFGWFGFNGGSALTPNDVAAVALLNTNIAAGVAMITWMFCEAMCGGNPSAIGAATGAICGLVAITPSAGYIPTLAAAPVGAMGAGCAFGFVWIDKHTEWFNWFSNPLDVMASHGVSGLVGSLLTGIFAFKPVNTDEPKLVENGLVFGGGPTLFLNCILATMIIITYSVVMTIFICVMLTKIFGVDGILSAALLLDLERPEHPTPTRHRHSQRRRLSIGN